MLKVVVSFALAATLCLAAETKLGKPLTLKQPMSVTEVNAKASALAGQTVQVKGKISEVCQTMGCWMQLTDADGTAVRIKVNDGEIVFPKEKLGKMAVAEGVMKKMELTKQQAVDRAKHEAEEQGRKFDPAKITGPVTIYQIQGTGAVILE